MKMQIFEPAMCCSTGLCGVAVDPELLRVSTVLDTLKKHGIAVDRFNLSSAPMEFVKNSAVNDYVSRQGADGLPVVLLDGAVAISGRYPTNAEFATLLDLPSGLIATQTIHIKPKAKSGGCGCKGGC